MNPAPSDEMNTPPSAEPLTSNPPAQPLLIKKNPLAAMLGVSGRTIDTWVSQRVIPYLATSPRMHLFDPQAVKDALQARFGVNANPPQPWT